jgi:hypothetical protein
MKRKEGLDFLTTFHLLVLSDGTYASQEGDSVTNHNLRSKAST